MTMHTFKYYFLCLALILSFPAASRSDWKPIFDGADSNRSQLQVQLKKVANGFKQTTDIQFIPNESTHFLALEKQGNIYWVDASSGEKGLVTTVEVLTRSEQGLLGLAFHPDFPKIPCFYLNYVARVRFSDHTVIAKWCGEYNGSIKTYQPKQTSILLTIEQPYRNHNAGQLLFGPDKQLYIPLGDGGSANDPLGHGQNTNTLLGAVLRLNVLGSDNEQYQIPEDNPFVNQKDIKPEIFAYGFRNPWRASFDHRGRLWIADVGQDKWEEINIVSAGKNYGWNQKEASHCFLVDEQTCDNGGLVDPIYEYNHTEGQSITGGYEWLSDVFPELKFHYIFADFVSGRLWAKDTDQDGKVVSLGRWPFYPSTFGQDAEGRVYVADFIGDGIYLITKPD